MPAPGRQGALAIAKTLNLTDGCSGVGVLIGLGLGAAVSVGAQPQLAPCAHAWIVWGRSAAMEWNSTDAFTSKAECERYVSRADKTLPSQGFYSYCYPDTFDPRGKQR